LEHAFLPGHQPEILPFRWKLLQRGRPAALPVAVRRADAAPAERELRSVGSERKRRQAVSVGACRPYRNRRVMGLRKWNAFKCLLDPLVGMNSIEIKRERVDELKGFIVLKDLPLIQPSACFWICRKVRLEA